MKVAHKRGLHPHFPVVLVIAQIYKTGSSWVNPFGAFGKKIVCIFHVIFPGTDRTH